MNRILLALIMAFCTISLAAQDDCIKVKFQSSAPAITDFVAALVADSESGEDNCDGESMAAFANAWKLHQQGKALPDGVKMIVDKKAGYVRFEERSEKDVLRIEMCYWNESDQKHKLFACGTHFFHNGVYSPGQFDGLTFYRYTNSTRKMTITGDVGYEFTCLSTDNAWISYELPQKGKDIIATTWHTKGPEHTTLKWTGRGFKK